MNKTELIAATAESCGMTKKDTERCLNAAIDTITQRLCMGDRVQVSGFGIFEVKERDARVGRNPRTRKTILIPSTKAPVFKASKALKDTIAK